MVLARLQVEFGFDWHMLRIIEQQKFIYKIGNFSQGVDNPSDVCLMNCSIIWFILTEQQQKFRGVARVTATFTNDLYLKKKKKNREASGD